MTAQPPTMETVCEQCGGVGELDTGGFTPDGTGILVACPTCTGTGNTQPPVGTEELDVALAPLSIEHRIFVKSRFMKLQAELTTLRTREAEAERKGWNEAVEAAIESLKTNGEFQALHCIRNLAKGESR